MFGLYGLKEVFGITGRACCCGCFGVLRVLCGIGHEYFVDSFRVTPDPEEMGDLRP